ncbi:ABC-type transport system, binding protein precursor component [Flavobacterium cauense R2A-7]|uniref:ABC-type Fe3+-hydroxamate transport system substrate-binding protein n=1 Tax=Flavobacterium cauense R2A-7 TaxID=1341154 RepID=V6S2Q0_9FLAO|nr:helical backbone metal receptor [Flavobacterium cauense]ESU20981.1 ABC-type transport system, binding protein precursor component [Flavobacterium cauense R2A-7]KGO79603.1 iron ABC transporter [Flavobacterium cauense R2A-7]TWI08351.1 ABC-type Fe3+-hydroxamate transport system substrate-binding protein [Flavobacterium cauense R2A-7]
MPNSKTYTDQLGNQHRFNQTPKRIISLVPSQTELLYDLGLEDSIVGITKFCVHPFHLKATKAIVGGTKQVKIDKIKALQPDIIIANKEENTLEIVESLQDICSVWVTDIITIEDNLQMISDFGQLFNKRIEAQKWIDKTNFALADFQHFIKDKEVKKVAYFIWANPYMVAGGDTFINELLKLNKFENIYDNHENLRGAEQHVAKYEGRYPEIVIQKMRIQGDPDYVLLSSEPFPFKDEHAFELGRHTHHATTIFVDGEMFSWYGSRLVKAIEYFKSLHERL